MGFQVGLAVLRVAVEQHHHQGKGGEAEVLLRLDGKEVAESRQTLKSGDPARRLSVSVRGGSRLTLEVLHGRGGPVRDAVDWCNAVLIP